MPSGFLKFEELHEKCQTLLKENRSFKAEIQALKRQSLLPDHSHPVLDKPKLLEEKPVDSPQDPKISNDKGVTNLSPPADKIGLFISLFRGREDVYAKKWESKAGKRGYSPVCLNEWKPGVCEKPRKKCSECKNRSLAALNKRAVENHLRGLMVMGIYPLCCDKTQHGKAIRVEFKGKLREEQQEAVGALIKYDIGVLSATTAFGKTVVGANLISKRKVNTLILVHRQQLLSQWIDRLSDFLLIQEKLPELPKKKGRKKTRSLIGQMGAGKNQLSGVIDVAMMQSLNSGEEVKECVQDYGMVIIDECHHVPAASFEQIMKKTTARFVYGLTATPARRDGHHPILFYQCGPIRFLVDAKKQAEERPFDHYIIPRFTSFKLPSKDGDNVPSIQGIYSELSVDEIRNDLIVDDVVDCRQKGRNSLVLTGRVAHVETLAGKLKDRIPDVVALTGGMGAKKTGNLLEKISSMPRGKPLTLVATGKFIGEGFDESRLDTLFLAMPISWKGTVQQYAGRLHRLCDNKKDVQVYDYVDIHVPMLEKMYGRRLKGYASIGYQSKGESVPGAPADIIFDNRSFFSVYTNDIENASKQILIVSPFVTEKRASQMMPYFGVLLKKQITITIITRPAEDFKNERQPILRGIFERLADAGVTVIFKSLIHQKFAVIDRKIVWYGSINLLSFGVSQESMMRLISGGIAQELMRSVNAADR